MKKYLVFILIFIASPALSATYYASPSGSGSTCLTGARCTLNTGLGLLAPGDTLILGDGTYNQRLTVSASGSAGSYRTIKAEHDGLAIISDNSNDYGAVVMISGSYNKLEGLKIVSTSVGGSLEGGIAITNGAGYNKIIRCASVVTPCNMGNHSCENRSNIDVSGHDNLIEDSWAWGGGRYKVITFGGDDVDTNGKNNLFRRVVVRHDREYSGGYNPQGGFQVYQAKNTTFQNCLVIDSDQLSYYDSTCRSPLNNCWYGAFIFAKGTKGGFTTFDGSMAINYGRSDSPAIDEGDAPVSDSDIMYRVGNITARNFFAYNGGGGFQLYQSPSTISRTLIFDHSFIGNTISTQIGDYDNRGDGFSAGLGNSVQANNAISTNNIFYNIVRDNLGGYGLYNVKGASKYNVLWGNTANYGGGATVGANDITNVNPITASMRYPTRIETGSPLKGAGDGGTDIGPTILKKIGVSGTLYGEPGWDTVTDENLWPWPNENRIKTDMSSYPPNWPADGQPNPIRGFTAGNSLDGTPQTLTKYIWETLGTQIPSDVYGTTSISLGTVLIGK